MARIVLAVFFGLAVWVGIHSAWTINAGVNAQPRPADVAIVLGTRVDRSGNPSRLLRERLDRAYELYQANMAQSVIVSGGLGREGFEEADVMREYLIRRGIPVERIEVDRAGYDTYETARSAKAIMDARAFRSAIMVSHYYHLPRAVITLKRFGIQDVSAAAVNVPPMWRDSFSVLREFAAFYFYLVRDYAAT